jgi:hypothetical protein
MFRGIVTNQHVIQYLLYTFLRAKAVTFLAGLISVINNYLGSANVISVQYLVNMSCLLMAQLVRITLRAEIIDIECDWIA